MRLLGTRKESFYQSFFYQSFSIPFRVSFCFAGFDKIFCERQTRQNTRRNEFIRTNDRIQRKMDGGQIERRSIPDCFFPYAGIPTTKRRSKNKIICFEY